MFGHTLHRVTSSGGRLMFICKMHYQHMNMMKVLASHCRPNRSSFLDTYNRFLPSTDYAFLSKHMSLSQKYSTSSSHDANQLKIDVHSHSTRYSVPYLDVNPEGSRCSVLAVHGAPGGLADFDSIIPALASAGVRVVVPNLPGNPHTTHEHPTMYDETTTARAIFIQDFMSAIGLKSVDLLIGHSLGGYAVMQLLGNSDVAKGAALLNHGSHRPHKGVQPYPLACLYADSLKVPVIGWFTKLPLIYLYKKRGFTVDDLDHVLQGMYTVRGIQFNLVKGNAKRIQEKNLPIFSATTQNDGIIEWQRSVEACRLLGLSESNDTYLDTEENVIKGPSIEETVIPRCLIFERGGHLAHRAHSSIVTKCILDLLKCIKGSDLSDNSEVGSR